MTRILLFTTVALATLALAAQSGAAGSVTMRSSQAFVIVGAKSIGGFKPASGTFTQAQTVFGNPFSETQSQKECIARWQDGLTLTWTRSLPYLKWGKACVAFKSARVAGTKWATDKGLRVGDSAARLKGLYPHALRRSAAGFAVSVIARDAKISLEAWAAKGHVRFFEIAPAT